MVSRHGQIIGHSFRQFRNCYHPRQIDGKSEPAQTRPRRILLIDAAHRRGIEKFQPNASSIAVARLSCALRDSLQPCFFYNLVLCERALCGHRFSRNMGSKTMPRDCHATISLSTREKRAEKCSLITCGEKSDALFIGEGKKVRGHLAASSSDVKRKVAVTGNA